MKRLSLTIYVIGTLALAGVVAALSATSLSPQGLSAPKLGIADSKDLPTPLPYPYDEKANAAAQVEAAFARAKVSGKRVLIDFGGNWCSWCRILAGVTGLPQMKPFMTAHFEQVAVDVGTFDKNRVVARNRDIAARYGAPKIGGVPWLVIAEPNGKVLVSSYEVTDEKHETPQAMADWLAHWAK